MVAIKRTPADIAFSKCVRAASDWTCQRCAKQYSDNSTGLECSHHHSRGNWSIRFDPMNAEALCTGCHFLEGGTEQRRKQVLTEAEQEILFEKMRDTGLGRLMRKTKGKGLIAKHYRGELKIIQEKRAEGILGFIKFEEYKELT